MLARLVTQLLLLALLGGCVTNVEPEDDVSKRAWQGFTDLKTQTGPVQPAGGGTTILSANFVEQADGADTYTLSFQVYPPKNPSSFFYYRAVATVTWSVEGQQVVRQLDVSNGASITGRGEGVVVQVADATPNLGLAGQTVQNPYTVSCTLTLGTRPSVNQPPILSGVTDASGSALPGPNLQGDITVAAGQTAGFKVPPGAISVQVTQNPNTVGIVTVSHITATSILKQYDPFAYTGFVPLAPNATNVFVTNVGGGAASHISLTWGIDG